MSETRNPAQVERLFVEALERRGEDRVAFLDDACADDVALRAHLVELVDAHELAGGFLQPPTISPPEGSTVEGKRIGRFRLRRVIATGGMGTVYEAIQEQPHRTVAIKVMRTGVTSRSSRRRFEYESQILARLRHPNIAQVFEAGTYDEGAGAVPYFAMEYVADGRPLVQYAEEEKLDRKQRLELFAKVCDAVQHGHQKGIIHRDIKPANILVDPTGDPKVIDFGVARATDSDVAITTLRTDIGQLIGTLQYMSPEQCNADPYDLDARSDVYMLGVVFYELLTGRPPYDLASVAVPEAVRIIRDLTPTRPSTLDRGLRGDLETIAVTALEKDRQRRYQTAGELGADIRRYLDEQPIVARPPSALYQLRKFARRNKALVGAAAFAFAALSFGVIVATWQAVQARAEATKATAISQYFMDLFALANPAEQTNEMLSTEVGPRIRTIARLMDEAGISLETALAEWPEVQADLYFRLGRTYWGLGRMDAVVPHLRRAYELRAAALGESHPDTLAVLNYWGGWISENQGRYKEAEQLHRRAYEGLESSLGPNDRRTISAKTWLGSNLKLHGKIEESERLMREVVDTCRRQFGETDRMTLSAQLWYAKGFGQYGRQEELEPYLTEVYERSKICLPEGDLLTAMIAQAIGDAKRRRKDHQGAVDLLLQARNWYQLQNSGVTKPALEASFSACGSLRALNRDAEAGEILASTLEACRSELGPDHGFTQWVLIKYARYLESVGRYLDAIELVQGFRPESWAPDNDYTVYFMLMYGRLLETGGKLGDAQAWFEKALTGARSLPGEAHDRALQATANLARVHADQGHIEEAVLHYRKVVEGRRERHGPDKRSTLTAMNSLAWHLKDLNDPQSLAEAERVAQEGATLARNALGDNDRLTLMIADTLAVVLHLRGRNDEAIVAFEQVAGGQVASISSVHYGRCLTELDRFEEAEAVLLDAYDGDEEFSLEALIGLYDAWGKPEKAAEYGALLREAEEGKAPD
jgi:tetratricopeptide (TPR) repeat protein/tRNA A-37 threonylcarbamoyl transferase component Bud32